MYRRLEEVLGTDEATTLMEHLPPVGWADVATKRDLDMLRLDLRAELHRELRNQLVVTVTAMLAANATLAALAFAAAKLT